MPKGAAVSASMLAPDDAIDLHIHTLYSDGHWLPVELFDHLAQNMFRVVAITDHDTVEHLDELKTLGAARGITVLAGVEMTTNWQGLSAHLLCYAKRLEGDALARLGQETVAAQLENTLQVHRELLRRGYVFPRQMEILSERQGNLTRPIDNATLLSAHGYTTSLDEALTLIADAGYHQITAPLAKVVTAARKDDALTVLAHPGRGGGEIQRYDIALLSKLLDEAPVDGIEAYYPTYTPEETQTYVALAHERGLLVSAGSDSHGRNQRLPIRYPARVSATLLERCGIHVTR